jgi:hypothetical protein
MAYSSSDFEQDAVKTARSLHLAFRRCEYLLDRWWSGMNTSFPNSGATIPMNNLMNRVAEMVADYEDDSNAKLNTVMAKSDLTLPGDV